MRYAEILSRAEHQAMVNQGHLELGRTLNMVPQGMTWHSPVQSSAHQDFLFAHEPKQTNLRPRTANKMPEYAQFEDTALNKENLMNEKVLANPSHQNDHLSYLAQRHNTYIDNPY